MKLEKISNLVLQIVCGITVLMLALFFLLPWETEGDKSVPMFTSPFLFFQYLMGLATAGLVIWSLVRSVQNSMGNDEVETTGIRGSKVIIGTAIATILSLVIGALMYVLGVGVVDKMEGLSVMENILVDGFMWSIGLLSLASVVAVVVAATGVLVKTNKA